MIAWENLAQMPMGYYGAGIVLLLLICEAVYWVRRRAWAFPALAVYGTVFLWYFIEPQINLYQYRRFDPTVISSAFLEVIAFLIGFRALIPFVAERIRSFTGQGTEVPEFTDASKLFHFVALAWLVLFAFGAIVNGQGVLQALFPFDARRTWKFMWSRGAVGGATSFLLSMGFYTYLISCAFIAVLVHFPKPRKVQLANIGLMLLTWPYFLLSGTRSHFLAVFIPFVLGYLILNRAPIYRKALVALGMLALLNAAFVLVITYRNYGFSSLLGGEDPYVMYVGPEHEFKGHEGLNMLEELCYINAFRGSGAYPVQWGKQYFDEAVNFVPRALWPNKPLVGFDYAIARGFGSARTASGVSATLSFGIVGQGVANFGPAFGPLFAAFLMACYVGLLTRFAHQNHSYLRIALYLAGIALIPNLGRGFSLLVLWPFVFGYALVRLLEYALHRQRQSMMPAPAPIVSRRNTPINSGLPEATS